jgi:glycosyltransferase involved in cell wall biosynthesis
VIPVYNGGIYFEKCLEGVMNQTYQNWECVVNNNHSTDGTLEVAERFAARDRRFKVFNNDDFLKMVDNWNMACSRISPDSAFLKVLGADDWLFPESLEKMVAVMVEHPGVGLCSSYRLNDTRVDMDGLNIWDGNVYDGKQMLHDQLTRRMDVSGSNTTILFSIEHMKKIPRFPVVFDQEAYHEDTELVYEMMNIADVGFVFQVLSYTRRHEKAATTTEVFRFNTLLQLNEKVLWQYKGSDPELNRIYRDTRLKYASFLFFRRLKLDRETIRWHKKYIVRKFRFHEYLLGILVHNKVSQLAIRAWGKIKNQFTG